MIPIICVSDDLGMTFNKRRQSRDEELIRYITERINGHRLLISSRSEDLFRSIPDLNVIIDDDFLNSAKSDDYCFVEFDALRPYKDKIHELIVCRWNRKYPSDMRFDLDLSNYKLTDSVDIKGKSHEKITIETWEK